MFGPIKAHRGKKIGDSSCKFDVCQKLPSFDGKKAPRRDKRPPRDAVAGASGASGVEARGMTAGRRPVPSPHPPSPNNNHNANENERDPERDTEHAAAAEPPPQKLAAAARGAVCSRLRRAGKNQI